MKNNEMGGYLIGIFHGAVIGALLTLAVKGYDYDQSANKNKIPETQRIDTPSTLEQK